MICRGVHEHSVGVITVNAIHEAVTIVSYLLSFLGPFFSQRFVWIEPEINQQVAHRR